jgi:hypothetical protein
MSIYLNKFNDLDLTDPNLFNDFNTNSFLVDDIAETSSAAQNFDKQSEQLTKRVIETNSEENLSKKQKNESQLQAIPVPPLDNKPTIIKPRNRMTIEFITKLAAVIFDVCKDTKVSISVIVKKDSTFWNNILQQIHKTSNLIDEYGNKNSYSIKSVQNTWKKFREKEEQNLVDLDNLAKLYYDKKPSFQETINEIFPEYSEQLHFNKKDKLIDIYLSAFTRQIRKTKGQFTIEFITKLVSVIFDACKEKKVFISTIKWRDDTFWGFVHDNFHATYELIDQFDNAVSYPIKSIRNVWDIFCEKESKKVLNLTNLSKLYYAKKTAFAETIKEGFPEYPYALNNISTSNYQTQPTGSISSNEHGLLEQNLETIIQSNEQFWLSHIPEDSQVLPKYS